MVCYDFVFKDMMTKGIALLINQKVFMINLTVNSHYFILISKIIKKKQEFISDFNLKL